MAYQFPTDIERHVAAWVGSGKYQSADEVLQDALRALAEEQGDWDAVEQAIAEWQAGDQGVPLQQALDELRARHGLSSEA